MPNSSAHSKPMVGYLADPANALTFAGFTLSVVATTLAFNGQLEWALTLVLWAVLADWYDGWLAGRTSGRHLDFGKIGGNLDSFADLMSGGIVPSVVLLRLGDGSAIACLVAIFVCAAGAIRLSYFNVFGTDAGSFVGMPFPQNIFNVALVYVVLIVAARDYLYAGLSAAVLICGLLNISQVRFKRIPKSRLPHATVYVIFLTGLLLIVKYIVNSPA